MSEPLPLPDAAIPQPDAAAPAPRRKRTLARVLGWSAIGLLAALASTITALLLVLAHLDHPAIARWLKGTLARDVGLELDYDALSLSPFSGLHAGNLRIRTPAAYAAHAPDLLVLEHADIAWSFWPLLRGEVRVSRLELAGMHLAMVTDESGKTSLDALLEQMGIEEESTPLSRSLQDLPALAVNDLAIGEIAVELIDAPAGAAATRTTITGLCAGGSLATSRAGLDADLRLAPCAGNGNDNDSGNGNTTAPPGIRLVIDNPGQSQELILDLQGKLTSPDPQRIAISLEGDLVHQNLLPGAALPRALLRAHIDVAFDAAAQHTRVHVPILALLDGAITATLTADLHDRADGTLIPAVPGATGAIDLERVLAILPEHTGNMALPGAHLRYEIEQIAIDPDTGLVQRGQVRMEAEIPEARLAADGTRLQLEPTSLRVDARLGTPEESTLHAALRVAGLHAETGSEQVSLAGFEATLDGKELQIDVKRPLFSRGTLGLDVRLDRANADMDGQLAAVRGLHLHGALLADGASLAASGSLPIDQVSLREPRSGLDLQVDRIALDWKANRFYWNFAQPAEGSMDLRLGTVRLKQPGQSLAVDDIRAQVQATVRNPRRFDITLTLPWKTITLRNAGGTTVSLGAGEVGVTASDLVVDAAAPEQARGRIQVTSALPQVDVRMPDMDTAVRDLELTLDAVLAGTQPPRLAGTLPIGRVEVRARPGGEHLARVTGGRLAWQVEDLVLDAEDPLRSSARITLEAALPRVILAGQGSADTALQVPRIDAALHLDGARQVHDASLRLVLAAVDAGGTRHGTNLVTTLKARAELQKPGIRVDIDVRGPEGPELDARLDAQYRRDRRSLGYELALVARRLDAVEYLLPAPVREAHRVDWKSLGLEIHGKGEVREVIRRFRPDMTPVLADDPLLALRGEQALRVDLTGLDYRAPDQALKIPQLALRFEGRKHEGPFEATLDIGSQRIYVENAGDPIDIVGLVHHTALSSAGPPERSRVEMTLTTTVDRVEQRLIGYPVEKLSLVARGHLDRLTSLRIEELRLDNPAGGTRLEARAAMDRVAPAGTVIPVDDTAADLAIPGRQSMSLSGTLRQDLKAISLGKNGPRLRGTLTLPFRVESGDLSAFLIASQVQLEGVHVSLPQLGIAVEGFDGVIPVVVDVAMLPDGKVLLLGSPSKNLYSRTRFSDVHPFLRDRHFLTVKRITAMGETIGPLAGNLRVERDTVALDQLQLGYRGGNISGQVLVDYRDGKPSVQFRGNLTGVQPSQRKDAVLDANAAITFVPDTLGLEGRIQILRISRQHLREVLDVIDPYRENVNINRVRLALRVGYPRFVRLVMKDGFLSVKIELGGAARLLRIGEIRGIALGPLMNIYVAPALVTGAGATP